MSETTTIDTAVWRGNGVTPQADAEAWAEHYRAHHGMTREGFFA